MIFFLYFGVQIRHEVGHIQTKSHSASEHHNFSVSSSPASKKEHHSSSTGHSTLSPFYTYVADCGMLFGSQHREKQLHFCYRNFDIRNHLEHKLALHTGGVVRASTPSRKVTPSQTCDFGDFEQRRNANVNATPRYVTSERNFSQNCVALLLSLFQTEKRIVQVF